MFVLQYGPIAHIDLKIPPRPPGYAFVEVRLLPLSVPSIFQFIQFSTKVYLFFNYSLKRLVMLKMLFVVVMVMILRGIGCGFLLHPTYLSISFFYVGSDYLLVAERLTQIS